MNNDSGEKKPGGESNTKAFIVLVALTLVFVGVVGGAFFGGTIVGKNQAEDSAAVDAPALPEGAAAAFAQFRQQAQSGQANQAAEQLRQQIRGQLGQGGGQAAAGAAQRGGGGAASGGADGGAGTSAAASGGAAGAAGTAGAGTGTGTGAAPARAAFGAGGAGGFAAAAGFGGGVFGTLTSVEGSELRIETPNGVVTVKLSEDTTLREISDVSVDDLETGIRITVAGTRDDSGTMEARTITIIPEGVGFGGGQGIGGGQGFGGRQRGQGGGGP